MVQKTTFSTGLDRVVQCFVEITGFEIGRFIIKIADLRFAYWHTSEIFEVAIAQ
jgi:hypothetical protein